ncbi:PREDICTED: uncharacterized protein LOC106807326 [Priapulus caudatus]|uniref:Uncharacterized protein LOC106807326 n=1 Tax=Priapulus caudatus TaxID=37621 RepID=A0ABM1DYV1_PRICU|nr:PREDICTED: uncharacterized protein LOC106807326 [Priapulus caudatus]
MSDSADDFHGGSATHSVEGTTATFILQDPLAREVSTVLHGDPWRTAALSSSSSSSSLLNYFGDALAHLLNVLKRWRGAERENESTDEETFVREYLERYGYLGNSESGSDASTNVVSEAIRKFQLMVGMNGSGDITDEVVRHMKTPRCGMKDFLTEREQTIMLNYTSVLGGENGKPVSAFF